MAGYILALDQGTTSSRAILYDDRARPIKMAQQPPLYKPQKRALSSKTRNKFGKRRLAVPMM